MRVAVALIAIGLTAVASAECPEIPLGPPGPAAGIVVMYGAAAGHLAGTSLARAGDVNGDGLGDFVIGAVNADPNGASCGAAYLIFGTAAGFTSPLSLGSLDGSNGVELRGAASGDFAGISVAAAGDVNGDGLSDVFVGAYAADPNGPSSGASYVVFGTLQGFPSALELSDLDGNNGFRLVGASALERSGRSVSSAGDFNGDGVDDMVVGALNSNAGGAGSGRAYVIFGQTEWPASVPLNGLNGNNGFKVNAANAGDMLGVSVAGAGDIDGDGFDDVILGGAEASPGGDASGAAWVLYGGEGPFSPVLHLSDLEPPDGAAIHGEAEGDLAGISVAGAGDVNGDGFDDLLVGASGASEAAGAAYVIFGSDDRLPETVDLSELDESTGFKLNGAVAGDRAGSAVSGAGDLDGDGTADVLVGAPDAQDGRGTAYVILGHDAMPPSIDLSTLEITTGFAIIGAALADHTGQSCAGTGDVDGDGRADIALGAPSADPAGSLSGAVHLLPGAGRDCNGNGSADLIDLACGTSGDVNGNGQPDECDADLDGDGIVGASDIRELLSAWGLCSRNPAPCAADLDGDGLVGMTDLLQLLAAWGAIPGP